MGQGAWNKRQSGRDPTYFSTCEKITATGDSLFSGRSLVEMENFYCEILDFKGILMAVSFWDIIGGYCAVLSVVSFWYSALVYFPGRLCLRCDGLCIKDTVLWYRSNILEASVLCCRSCRAVFFDSVEILIFRMSLFPGRLCLRWEVVSSFSVEGCFFTVHDISRASQILRVASCFGDFNYWVSNGPARQCMGWEEPGPMMSEYLRIM